MTDYPCSNKSTIQPGQLLTISGDGFVLKPALNTVNFGDEEVEVIANSSLEMIVKVPDNLTGQTEVIINKHQMFVINSIIGFAK